MTSPRGIETLELLNHTSTMDMNYPVLMCEGRELGYRFLLAEAAWILSGDNRVKTISPYSKAIKNFSDDGVSFFGAYGPRFVDQIGYVTAKLAEDLSSRQAVMEIWRPSPPKSKDIPCTVAVQWMVREDKLYCFDTMRSSDIWLGHPYDAFNFSMASLFVLLRLREAYGIKLELGDLFLTAASKHLYLKDMPKSNAVIDAFVSGKYQTEDCVGPRFSPDMFEDEDDLVQQLWKAAEGHGLEHFDKLS